MSSVFVQTQEEYNAQPVQADCYVIIKVTAPEFVEAAYNSEKKIILDFCDPTWWFEPVKVRLGCDYAHRITFSNKPLMDDFVDWYGDGARASVIPDRLKLSHYSKQRKHYHASPVRFIWFGAGQNRQSVVGAFPYLERLTKNGVNISLTIMDDHPGENWLSDYAFPIYYTQWGLDVENQVIADHDIAILPPYPGAWGNVKSNNKSLTAWACGLPVTTGENWEELFTRAVSSDARQATVDLNRKLLEQYYDVRQTADQYQSLLASL
jgi:hypothetical protein